MTQPAYRCLRVRSPRGARTTEIDWGDGHKSVYPHDILRGYCPCAACQGHSGTIEYKASDGPDSRLEIENLELVGNYALGLKWFDGHDSGIYSFIYLRELCQCDTCVLASAAQRHEPLPRP